MPNGGRHMSKTFNETEIELSKNKRPIWIVFWIGFFVCLSIETYTNEITKQEQIRAEESCRKN